MKLMSLLLVIISTGCLPPQAQGLSDAFRVRMNGWIGLDINQVMRGYGPPSSEYAMPNGNHIYTWVKGRNVSMTMPMGGAMVQQQGFRGCQVAFEVNPAGIIQSWSANGNDCK